MAAFWVPLIWLVVAVALLALELAQPSFDGLMFAALAALVVSVLTALGPLPTLIQVALFVLITVVGTLWLTRWSTSRNPEPSTQHQQEELADVLSAIPAGREGRVRWHGQSWAASSLDLDRDLEPGERVLVVGRDGTQLQVMATTIASGCTPAFWADIVLNHPDAAADLDRSAIALDWGYEADHDFSTSQRGLW